MALCYSLCYSRTICCPIIEYKILDFILNTLLEFNFRYALEISYWGKNISVHFKEARSFSWLSVRKNKYTSSLTNKNLIAYEPLLTPLLISPPPPLRICKKWYNYRNPDKCFSKNKHHTISVNPYNIHCKKDKYFWLQFFWRLLLFNETCLVV